MLSVSVVIPTIGHAGLRRAVESALAQTYGVCEILVVADTLAELDVPANDRVRILRVGPCAGGNVARQTGITHAHGDAIALLDDDDEWLPHRLQRQVEEIKQAGVALSGSWIATSRITRVAGKSRTVLPSRPLRDGEDLRRYLFIKRTPRSDHGFIQASTLLFPKKLATEVPFDPALKFHQDISWLIDAIEHSPRLTVVQVWEPLIIYNSLPGSVSKRIDPLESVEWARGRLERAGPRVLGDFILTQSMGFARRSGPRSMAKVFGKGLRYGRPGTSAVVYAALIVLQSAFAAAIHTPIRRDDSQESN